MRNISWSMGLGDPERDGIQTHQFDRYQNFYAQSHQGNRAVETLKHKKEAVYVCGCDIRYMHTYIHTTAVCMWSLKSFDRGKA